MKTAVLKFCFLLTLLAGILLFFCPGAKALATADTGGVEFTPISASADNNNPAKPHVNKQPKVVASVPIAHHTESKGLWAIFIAGLAGGFAAFFMPCIFPMVPLTVSFFTKGSANRKKGVIKALIYGASIIGIYVVLGLLVTVIFGASALNDLSTNGVFNMAFFLVLVLFAASFLGAFELTLPSKWVNAADARSEKSGMTGIMFMAATLALVSFSCTGPIVGSLLAQAATTGALLGPAVGMFGYSLALALPFVLFAMFPGMMSSLPKSGGWLNSVKVILGFLELALSFKFLSNVDLAYHWHLFNREIFLVLWIVIFALMGFYLLGKLVFSFDSPLPYIPVPRLFLAIIVFSFSMYMVPGLWGAPLKSISAFLPPQSTQDFDLSNLISNPPYVSPAQSFKHKYDDLFDKPKGFDPFFDYDEGIAYAKKEHKPVMIDFTGHACVNCRKMEADVWTDKQVYAVITQKYVLIQLYVDDKTDLAAAEQTTTPEGRSIRTIGNKWSYLQTSRFQSNSQPFYVLLNPDTGQPLVAPQGAEYDPAVYLQYLNSGLKVYAP